MKKNKKLDIIVVGFAVFSIFFGAGNLIFPPYLGMESGNNWWISNLGFIISGVGVTVLGLITLSNLDNNVDKLAGKVFPKFGTILGVINALIIGPLLIIPRIGATFYEIALENLDTSIPKIIFILIFFGIALYFALTPTNVVDRLGKFLTPILIISLSILILKSVFFPVHKPIETNMVSNFSIGFQEGYQTMDTLGVLVIVNIISKVMSMKGYTEKEEKRKFSIYVSLIAGTGLALVYTGLAYLGSTLSYLNLEKISRTELLSLISKTYLGEFGGIVLSIAITFACLTTAIGMTASTSEYFENVSKGKLKYKNLCILTIIFSTVTSIKGVEYIITIARPILLIIYPIVIALLILGSLGKLIKNNMIYKGVILGAFIVGSLQAIDLIMNISKLTEIINILPLADKGLPWIVPSVSLGFIFYISNLIFVKLKENNKKI